MKANVNMKRCICIDLIVRKVNNSIIEFYIKMFTVLVKIYYLTIQSLQIFIYNTQITIYHSVKFTKKITKLRIFSNKLILDTCN